VAPGCEELNDHEVLRKDSVLALLVGKAHLSGEQRLRAPDRGNPLAGSRTLERLEPGTPEGANSAGYTEIAADPEALDRLLVDVFLESHKRLPREIGLD